MTPGTLPRLLPAARRITVGLLLAVCCAAPRALADSVQERLGYPPEARLLMIHADDLGMSQAVNQASLEALENGWRRSSTSTAGWDGRAACR